MRRLLVPLLLSATLLAACGGGSGTAAKVATPATPTSATKAPSFSGNGGSTWCGLDRSLQDSTQFQNSLKDPHAWVNQVNSILPKVERQAPNAIHNDVVTLVTAVQTMVKAVVDANYDFTKISPSAVAALQDPKFNAASDRVIAYDKQVCGTNG